MYLTGRFYVVMVAVAILLASGFIAAPLFVAGQVALVVLAVALVADVLTLYARVSLSASRGIADRLSLGDDNTVTVNIENRSPLRLWLTIIDELPKQLQWRDFSLSAQVKPRSASDVSYLLRPTQRGEYAFGHVLVFAATRLGLAQRRLRCAQPAVVKVYPSYIMLRRYSLLNDNNNFTEMGIKRVRRAGNNTEYEQIKDYVKGDDYRSINWKASARRSRLMVNVYQDERSQQVFSLIDKGRLMQQSFQEMTLLDHAINASLVMSYVAVKKADKAGVITFADKMGSFVPASRRQTQMHHILECLYNEQTTFGDTDFSILTPILNRLVARRSFMVLYTNFVDMAGLQRQLPYLRSLNMRHRLLVVFFDDTQLADFIQQPVKGGMDCYRHVIAEKLSFEKRLIVNTLQQNGIYSLLTSPQKLTIDVVNKYLEMKSRHLLT